MPREKETIDSVIAKYPNYPYQTIRRNVYGTEVSILGVMHVLEFFQAGEQFFRDIVTAHDAIMLEQPIGGEFWEAPFFNAIAEIAHEQGKRVYQADPRTADTYMMDQYLSCIVAGMLLGGSIRNARKCTRRDFLKSLGKAGLATSLLAGNMPGLGMRAGYDNDFAMEYGIDDLLSYGEFDHSNIKIAMGLERVCRDVPDVGSIAVIHGAMHTDHIDAYLTNKALRAKLFAYIPYELLDKRFVREYIPVEYGWELRREL